MSILTRSSVLAIKKETTEGTPVPPAAAADYVALQDGFTMSPNFNQLENAELKASIGLAKSITGAEAPTASLSHYLRHSGVEGTAPNYGELLEACLGEVVVASTQYDTVGGSTVSAINVDVGEGVNFQRGQALLIKDPVNGYRIRALDSVAGDVLTPGFQLPAGTAPGSGVNLGRCVLYKPANADHPTLTLWHYVGNGGAVQMMAGARVTSATFDISAGELINGSYDIEGTGFWFNPIQITATNNTISFDIGGGPLTATVAQKFYKTPHELAAAMQSAISAAAAGTYTVSYSDTTGRFTVTKSAGTLDIDWATGTNSIGPTIGFTADDTGALSYTGDLPLDLSSPQTPSFDAADPLAAKDNEVMLGKAADQICFKASTVSFAISTPKSDIPSVCSQSGIDGSIINSREVTVSISALLEQYDAIDFERFRTNDEVKFQYSFGTKSGGNWEPGKCGALYIPTATISSFSIDDADGLAQLNIELRAFVNSTGDGEVYVSFV